MIADLPGPFETAVTNACCWLASKIRTLWGRPVELYKAEATTHAALSSREHASAFLRETIEPAAPGSAVSLSSLNELYMGWCSVGGHSPLPAKQLGFELKTIVGALGLPYNLTDGDVLIRGIKLRPNRRVG